MPKSYTLAVKIDKSLNSGKPLIDSVSGFWILNEKKAKMITTIVAISNQKVVGVFKVSDPYKVSVGVDTGRTGFHSVKLLPQSKWALYQSMQPFSFPCSIKYI